MVRRKDAKNGSAACTSLRRKVEHTSKAALGGFADVGVVTCNSRWSMAH